MKPMIIIATNELLLQLLLLPTMSSKESNGRLNVHF